MTPLHLAAKNARVRVIEYLVGKERDIINIQDLDEVTIIVCDCINDERLLWLGSYCYIILRHLR